MLDKMNEGATKIQNKFREYLARKKAKDEKAIQPLILTLSDNNKLVRREASTALSRMGPAAVDPLIEVLDDPDWRVRGAAAWALGNLDDEKAIPALEKLLDDESGYVKSGAQSAIATIKRKA